MYYTVFIESLYRAFWGRPESAQRHRSYAMRLCIPKETTPSETRVAVVPTQAAAFLKAGHHVTIEAGAGELAGYSDDEYRAVGVEIENRARVFSEAEVMLVVQGGSNSAPEYLESLKGLKDGAVVIGLMEPYAPHAVFEAYSARHATVFALELIPRITRAQSMDVLSSTAMLAGYRAVMLAAGTLPRIFPMMMTAAGTLAPAKVFVLGAGVAGLQAIATAKRLGAVVSAYDVRPVVREQVESLGAKFVEVPIEASQSETKGGYAKQMDEEFYRRQSQLLGDVISESDVVITTASVPGKPSPRLVTKEMVARMKKCSVIVDLAAQRGGNCELSQLGKTVHAHGVTILAPENAATALAYNASQLYARNIAVFFNNLLVDGAPDLDREDEIITSTLVIKDGNIVLPALIGSEAEVPVINTAGRQDDGGSST